MCRGGLGRSYDEVTWILTTYLVANAVILPMSAWLSRVFGRKNYYLGCVALFTLTSSLSSYFTGVYLDKGVSPRTVSLVLGALFFFPGVAWMLILSRWRPSEVARPRASEVDDRDEVLRGRIT